MNQINITFYEESAMETTRLIRISRIFKKAASRGKFKLCDRLYQEILNIRNRSA